MSNTVDRRDFMKTSGAAAVGAAAALNTSPASAAKKTGDDGLIHLNEREGMKYRQLGRTKFMSSALVFGCGAALAGGKAVKLLETSFEAGVNCYDVGSNIYYKGSERHLAPFMKKHRDDIFVVSKAPVRPIAGREPGTPLTVEQGKFLGKYWTDLLEDSLRDLDTDYIDAYYLMGLGDASIARSEELYEAYLAARDAGKIGHWGISTHKDAAAILEVMIETGWYDLAMIAVTPSGWYDWDSRNLLPGTPPLTEIQPLLKRARESGVGLVGMKAARYIAPAMAGGNATTDAFDKHYPKGLLDSDLSPFQKSYAYCLERGLDVMNADMQNFAHFEENVAAIQRSEEALA